MPDPELLAELEPLLCPPPELLLPALPELPLELLPELLVEPIPELPLELLPELLLEPLPSPLPPWASPVPT